LTAKSVAATATMAYPYAGRGWTTRANLQM
jgi:hypothetical protein